MEAKKDVDTDDETFGVQLCTTANCTGGTDDSPETSAIARVNGAPAAGGIKDNPGDWYVVAHFPTMITTIDPGDPDADPPVPSSWTTRAATIADMVATVNITARQNIQDTPVLRDDMKFKVVKAADPDDTNVSNYVNNDDYSGITLHQVPVTVTGDDDPTEIRLLPRTILPKRAAHRTLPSSGSH